MANGLFGMGGMGGFAPSMPQQMQGLFDPQEMKRAQLKQLLLSGGLSMLGQGPSELPINFGTSLGQGLQAGIKAADQTGKDYRDTAYQTFKINQDADQQKYERGRDTANDDWRHKQFEYGMNRDKQDDAWKRTQFDYGVNRDGINDQYKQLEMQSSRSKATAPQIETLYDDKTGQPYKGQYNPETGGWDRIGGSKAPDGGVTITNPDGTITQIGGGNKMTEADHKAQLLAQQIAGQEGDVMAGFESLAQPMNTIGSNLGVRGVMDEQAQISEDSLKNVVANWLYLTSGATATEGEVNRQFSMIRPSYWDKPGAIQKKRDRLQTIIRDMKQRGNIQQQPSMNQMQAPSQGGWKIEEVQ